MNMAADAGLRRSDDHELAIGLVDVVEQAGAVNTEGRCAAHVRESHAGTAWRAAPPDREQLRRRGDELLRAARRSGAPLGMLVMQLFDLPEVQLVFGPDAVEHVIDEALGELAQIAGTGGLAVRTARDTLALAIPGLDGPALERRLRKRLGKACWIDFELDGHEIVLVPDVSVCIVAAGETVEAACERLCDEIESERRLQQCRVPEPDCAPEAATVPMELPVAPAPARAAPAPWRPAITRYATIPATIPMPIGAH